MANIKNDPITLNTVIGSRKITAAEFRKFFKQELGDDYEKYPIAYNVIKISSHYTGKSLKEIITECFNPSKYEILEIITLEYQKNHKPKIEEVIPHILDGDMQKTALDFTAHLRENKISPRWASHNSWVARSGGKNVCGIRISKKSSDWCINPSFDFVEYEKRIIHEDMRNLILDSVVSLRCGYKAGTRCGMKNKTLFGKTFDLMCSCSPIEIKNPNAEQIEIIKRLVLIIKQMNSDFAKMKKP